MKAIPPLLSTVLFDIDLLLPALGHDAPAKPNGLFIPAGNTANGEVPTTAR